MLLVISVVFPILVGIKSPVTFLIVGIALYEAWTINKRPTQRMTGPHSVVAAGASPTSPQGPGGAG